MRDGTRRPSVFVENFDESYSVVVELNKILYSVFCVSH